MKFIITKSSLMRGYDREAKPCQEAVQDGTFSPDYLDDDMVYPNWVIEINSLGELMQFFEKHGNLVIRKAEGQPWEWLAQEKDETILEIYDDYRE